MIRVQSFNTVLYLVLFIILQSIGPNVSVSLKNSARSIEQRTFFNSEDTNKGGEQAKSNAETDIPIVTPVPCSCDDENATTTHEELTNDEKRKQTVQQGILRFSLLFENLISKSKDKETNVLFAPVNILGILTTVLLGAEAEGKNEILNLLGFSVGGKDLTNKEHAIHNVLGNLFNNFTSEGERNAAVKTKTNQAIFYQNGITLKEEFTKFAQQYYKNEFINLNFTSGDNEAVTEINRWVANHTENRINEMLKPPLPQDTKLILLNTLFFNGEWEEPFYENSTMNDFYTEEGVVKVTTMSNSGNIYSYYNSTNNFSVIGLPYKGLDTIMYIILPDKGEKLRNVLSKITPQDLHEIINNMQLETDVRYSLPYMQLSENLSLKQSLETLGVKNIFDSTKANLTNMVENENLYVSDALHNVNLDVTEAGSTGAASTALIIETKFPGRLIQVNRPFSFFIIHRPSRMISFWATINNPKSNN